MTEVPLLLVFLICVSARHTPASPSFFEENPSASASDLLQLDSSQWNHPTFERFVRPRKEHAPFSSNSRSTKPPIPPRTRGGNRFLVNTKLKQENDYALCNTQSKANVATRRKGEVVAGSKGHTYSEKDGALKSLICKSKSFKITNKNGKLNREAVEGTAMLSNDGSVDKLLNSHKTNSKLLELGSSGKSSISGNASKKEVVSAIETQGKNAGMSSVSKSRLVPHGLETISSVDGGTSMEKKGLGMRSWGKEATQLVSNPRSSSRNNDRTSGSTLTRLTHRKKSNFEIEV